MADRNMAGGGRLTMLAALVIVLLAAGAVWWPHPSVRPLGAMLVVLDPAGDEKRAAETWPAFAKLLTVDPEAPVRVVVARTLAEFHELVRGAPDFLACPDGVALAVDSKRYVPMAAGRRPAPRNLRPRGVLVSRRSAASEAEPWLSRPASTILGDSLSLTASGVFRVSASAAGDRVLQTLACGPDPYDHAAALHALRLGCFDYALVRQWDAQRFFDENLLAGDEWSVAPVTAPTPDLVVMVSRDLAPQVRMVLGQHLAEVGRRLTDETATERELGMALAAIGLAGFNLLIEPDFELIRSNFGVDWPPHRN